MPDISMCRNETCRLRFTCFRFLAEPGDPQSYANWKIEVIDGHETCDGYTIVRSSDRLRGQNRKTGSTP